MLPAKRALDRAQRNQPGEVDSLSKRRANHGGQDPWVRQAQGSPHASLSSAGQQQGQSSAEHGVDDLARHLDLDGAGGADDPSQTIMAVASQGSSIGVAIYDPLQGTLSCLQFSDDAPKGQLAHNEARGPGQAAPYGYQALQLVKLQVNPCCIYVSSKADAALVEACRRPPLGGVEAGEGVAEAAGCEVKTERASCFHYSQASFPLGWGVLVVLAVQVCRCVRVYTHGFVICPMHYSPLQAIKNLDFLLVQGMPDTETQQDRLNYLNTLIDLSREQQMAALGALLFILQRVGQYHRSRCSCLP